MVLAPKTIIDDRFEIISVRGAGGQGTVYEARQLVLDRRVALKLMRYAVDDLEVSGRFLLEAKVLSAISHKNLPQFYGYGIVDRDPYIAMEWLEGETLARRLSTRGKLSIAEALWLFRQIAEGLQHAHAHDIVHRDLKPENVMLLTADDGKVNVKVLDFGLSKLLSPDSTLQQQLTEVGHAVGTVQYMSPEQCQSEPVTAASDIYAFGSILHEALTGEFAFNAESPIAIMMMQCTQPAPRLLVPKDSQQAAVIESCQKLIDCCMKKSTAERYTQIKFVLEHLEEVSRLLEAVQTNEFYATAEADSVTTTSIPWSGEGQEQQQTENRHPAASAAAVLAALGVFIVMFIGIQINLNFPAFANGVFKSTRSWLPSIIGSDRYVKAFVDAALTTRAGEGLNLQMIEWCGQQVPEPIDAECLLAEQLLAQAAGPNTHIVDSVPMSDLFKRLSLRLRDARQQNDMKTQFDLLNHLILLHEKFRPPATKALQSLHIGRAADNLKYGFQKEAVADLQLVEFIPPLQPSDGKLYQIVATELADIEADKNHFDVALALASGEIASVKALIKKHGRDEVMVSTFGVFERMAALKHHLTGVNLRQFSKPTADLEYICANLTPSENRIVQLAALNNIYLLQRNFDGAHYAQNEYVFTMTKANLWNKDNLVNLLGALQHNLLKAEYGQNNEQQLDPMPVIESQLRSPDAVARLHGLVTKLDYVIAVKDTVKIKETVAEILRTAKSVRNVPNLKAQALARCIDANKDMPAESRIAIANEAVKTAASPFWKFRTEWLRARIIASPAAKSVAYERCNIIRADHKEVDTDPDFQKEYECFTRL